MQKKLILLFALAAACEKDVTPGAKPFQVNCTVETPSAEAKRPAGPQQDGSHLLIGGHRISPAGKLLDIGGFPLSMRVLPGDRYVVVSDGFYGDEALRVVDLMSADPKSSVVSKIDYPATRQSSSDPALFYGLALTADGKRIYVSNGGHDPVPNSKPGIEHYNVIEVFDIVGTAPPKLVKNEALTLKLYFNPGNATDGSASARLPAGVTLSADEKLLYAATQLDGTLAIVDLAPGSGYGAEIGRVVLPGISPFDVVVDEPSKTAFVSLWGASGVAVVNVADPKKPLALPMPLPTGKSPEAELLLEGHLWVANADADTITRYDVKNKVFEHKDTSIVPELLGSAPNNLHIDRAARRLFVANAGDNSVQVFDLDTLISKGRIPTAWYPTAVAALADGTVVIASGKGLGVGPTDGSSDDDDKIPEGVLQVVPRPSDADLAAGEKTVRENFARPVAYEPRLTCPSSGEKRFPLPPDDKSPTPIEHVFLIVRENKTYDAVLGDLAGANGDNKLTLFGENITPNLHALARRFANLDNFYSNAEQSLQGHEWTTAGISNDYVEKAWPTTWGRGYRTLAAFAAGPFEKLAHPGSDTLWVHLDKGKVPYHNYGEVVNTVGAKIVYDISYPGVLYNMERLDVDKVQYVIDTSFAADHALEPFTYILLPNDHTYGTATGKPTPESMVADNDEATGRFVDALSHSPAWPKSLVIILEDDPQQGADHIEAHRSPCVIISPWVKRGYASSVNYDVPSVMKLIMRILHLPPLNINDANAAAMNDIFADQPDLEPYTFIPRKVPMKKNAADAPMAKESNAIDWSRIDGAPLGRILWKAMRGKDAEPPWGPTESPRGTRDHDGDDD